MIKNLLGIILLSGTMSLNPSIQNIIYDSGEDEIIVTASEMNDTVFNNLWTWFDYNEDDDSINAQDYFNLYYNNVSCGYDWDLSWSCSIGDNDYNIFFNKTSYKFVIEDLGSGITDFEYDVKITSPDSVNVYDAMLADIQAMNPTPDPEPENQNLYGTIYNFFFDLFDNEDISSYHLTIMSVDTTLSSWLAHTVTILLLALGILWLILVIRWCFRVGAGLLHW